MTTALFIIISLELLIILRLRSIIRIYESSYQEKQSAEIPWKTNIEK